jgi:16S rRNA (cytidine1402-2'-O)-methyltransferase
MLYIISTPIGNLQDLSQRAKDIFCGCDLVLAEDTRQARKILNHLGVSKRVVSCHEHTGGNKLEGIIDEISKTKSAVYCSDAGAPNLSDPGGKLVEGVLEKGVEVSPIPGPSALTTLISVCPFACSRFEFIGYFPKKKGRQTAAWYIKNSEIPIFFFESPHRIKKTVAILKEKLPEKKVIIGRELTKKFEQITISHLSQINIDTICEKGEFVLGIF